MLEFINSLFGSYVALIPEKARLAVISLMLFLAMLAGAVIAGAVLPPRADAYVKLRVNDQLAPLQLRVLALENQDADMHDALNWMNDQLADRLGIARRTPLLPPLHH